MRGLIIMSWILLSILSETASAERIIYQTELKFVSDYIELSREVLDLPSVKYTYEFKNSEGAVFFQNTASYAYHFPFLKRTFPKYKHLTFEQYEEAIFSKTEKFLSVGTTYYLKNVPQFPGQDGIAFDVYYREEFPLSEVIEVHSRLKEVAPFAASRFIYVFERDSDFRTHQASLKNQGIPSIPQSKLVPTPAVSFERSVAQGTYLFDYHNHGWNHFEFRLGEDRSINIRTPEGDASSPKRNVTHGFRPLLRYNAFSLKGFGGHEVSFAVWKDELSATSPRDVFCRPIVQMVDLLKENFPKSMKDFLTYFGVSESQGKYLCPAEIRKPFERPGLGGTVFAQDMLCLVSSKGRTDDGPKLISAYIPFRYSETEIRPFLNEWPAEEFTVCVDGKSYTLREVEISLPTEETLSARSPALNCPEGQQPHRAQFNLGTADFVWETCTFLGGGHTTGYTIEKVSVKDSNKKIPKEKRGKLVTFGKDKLKDENLFRYKWIHHNGCDSFYLNAEEIGAEYGATTSPIAGCGRPVEGAPPHAWSSDEPDGNKKARYWVNYGGGFSKPKATSFAHYLFRHGE